jgi:hypothetical protein
MPDYILYLATFSAKVISFLDIVLTIIGPNNSFLKAIIPGVTSIIIVDNPLI